LSYSPQNVAKLMKALACILTLLVSGCAHQRVSSSVYEYHTGVVSAEAVVVGWRMHIQVETNEDGSGVDRRISRCYELAFSYLEQNTLVRKVYRETGVNPMCNVTFGKYRYKFAFDGPIVEPMSVCMEVYVSSPSGMAYHGTGEIDCDVQVTVHEGGPSQSK
jgi:hypothetical protein